MLTMLTMLTVQGVLIRTSAVPELTPGVLTTVTTATFVATTMAATTASTAAIQVNKGSSGV